MKRLLSLLVFFAASTAYAAADQPRLCTIGTAAAPLLSAVALDGAAGTRTFTVGPTATCLGAGESTPVRVASFKYLVLNLALVTDETSTLVLTHLVGPTVATATHTPGICAVSTGTCTSSSGGVTNIVTAGANISRSHRYDIRGWPASSIVVSLASADAADTITITGYLTD